MLVNKLPSKHAEWWECLIFTCSTFWVLHVVLGRQLQTQCCMKRNSLIGMGLFPLWGKKKAGTSNLQLLITWLGVCESPLSELCVTSGGASRLIKAPLFSEVQLLKLLHFLLMVVPDKEELDLWKRWRCLDKLQYRSEPAWQVRAWKGKTRKPTNVSVERRDMGNQPPRTSWTCYFAGVTPGLHT